ncbi:hypothetical protein GF339_06825 [candidate division KSB3 bacterium]|uniref:DUF4350 domain-containing protein n=1 Tax=candidate division KSB3 bacterium TaxID=2044937 RepID=A0A9D5JUD8_9BACT|nr:hypothetical protein [candidate division KSB3 bacterium]MBD3324280.1 hypothetical protein [candidate division KSB3 bacterium]
MLLLLPLLMPVSALATTISMEYSLGFSGYFQLETWTPVTVVLENRGRAMRGTLEVLVTSGSEYIGDVHQTTYAMEVDLPYNAQRLCALTIRIASFTHELVIRLRDEEQILLSRSLNLRPHYTTTGFAVVVAENTSPDFLARLPQQLTPVNVRPRFLPDTWYGYQSVRMLITTADMLESLRERQFQALTYWLKQGGFLVISAGINYGALLEQRIQGLFPIQVMGHRQVTALRAFEEFCGYPLTSDDPFLVLQTAIPGSKVLIQDDQLPILTQKRVGRGKLLFLSLDPHLPPFSRWTHRPVFWDQVLAVGPSRDSRSIAVDEEAILKALVAAMPVSFPNVRVVLLFMGVYALLLYLLFRRIARHQEQPWRYGGYHLLIGIVLVSIASYGLFFSPQARRRLTYNSFLHLTVHHGMATGGSIIGLYATTATSYDVSVGAIPSPITHLRPPTSDSLSPNPYVLYETTAGQRVRGSAGQWTQSFFQVSTAQGFPLSGYVYRDEQGVQLVIDNQTPYTLVDCWGYVENRLVFLGDIAPHQSQRKHIASALLEQQPPFDQQAGELIAQQIEIPWGGSFLSSMQKALIEDILDAVREAYHSNDGQIALFGWIPSAMIPVEFSAAAIPGDDLTLVTWELPVVAETPP